MNHSKEECLAKDRDCADVRLLAKVQHNCTAGLKKAELCFFFFFFNHVLPGGWEFSFTICFKNVFLQCQSVVEHYISEVPWQPRCYCMSVVGILGLQYQWQENWNIESIIIQSNLNNFPIYLKGKVKLVQF